MIVGLELGVNFGKGDIYLGDNCNNEISNSLFEQSYEYPD